MNEQMRELIEEIKAVTTGRNYAESSHKCQFIDRETVGRIMRGFARASETALSLVTDNDRLRTEKVELKARLKRGETANRILRATNENLNLWIADHGRAINLNVSEREYLQGKINGIERMNRGQLKTLTCVVLERDKLKDRNKSQAAIISELSKRNIQLEAWSKENARLAACNKFKISINAALLIGFGVGFAGGMVAVELFTILGA